MKTTNDGEKASVRTCDRTDGLRDARYEMRKLLSAIFLVGHCIAAGVPGQPEGPEL
jgi:hypothetical protein